MSSVALHPMIVRAGPAERARAGVAALIALVVAVAVVSRLSYLGLPFDGDGAMFASMGKLVAEGGRFGEDLVDNKLPTVGLVTAPFWWAFGAWWAGYVVTQLLMTFVAAGVLARQAGRSFGPHARAATFVVAVTLMNLNAAVMGGFQLESIQTFFATLSAACGLAALRSGDRRDALACGLAAGMAALVKPTGAGVLGALAVAVTVAALRGGGRSLVGRAGLGLAFAAFAGFSLPVLAALLYLVESDTLRHLPATVAQIGTYARNSSFDPIDLFRPLSLLALFAAAVAVRGWVFRRPAHRVPGCGDAAAWAFAVAWLAIELLGVLMQRRMYAYHFLPLAAPAALCFAAIPRRNALGQLAGALALPVVLSVWGAWDTIRLARLQPDSAGAVSHWLGARTTPGERVWRDVTPSVLLRTDLRSASRVQLTFLFMNSDTAPQEFAGMLLDDWRRHRPRYVVLPADVAEHVRVQTTGVFELAREPVRRANFAGAWAGIDAYVRAHYAPAARLGDETIWERREAGVNR